MWTEWLEQMPFFMFSAGKLIVGLFIAEGLFVYSLNKRARFGLRLTFGLIVVMLYTIFVEPTISIFTGSTVILRIANFIVVLVLLIFQIWFAFNCSFKVALSVGASAAATQHISSDIVLIGECLGLTSDNVGELWYNLFTILIMVGVYVLVFALFGRNVKRIRLDTKSWKNVIVSIFMLVVIAVLELSARSVRGISTIALLIIRIYDAVSIFVSLAMLYEIFSNFQIRLENAMMQQILHEKENYYELYKENISIINAKCHDMKYLLMGLHKGEGQLSGDIVDEIDKTINIYDAIAKTGNAALDVVLTEKALYCEKHDILLEYMIDGKHLSFIADTDIYAIFGNALDNAIEHVINVADISKRIIDLSVKKSEGLIIIRMNNYCKERLAMEDGLPVTTKNNRDYHGFGMKSMKMIAEKYYGSLNVSQKEDIFSLSIVIPAGVSDTK